MDDLGFILLSYVAAFAGTGLLAWWALRRGRALARQVPDEDKSWT